MSDRDSFLGKAPSLTQELGSVPAGRRRLGFLVIGAAVVLGSTVLFLLFLSSVYLRDPKTMHQTLLETMSREIASRLGPDAADREEEVADAFRALAAANDAGSLSLHGLFTVTRSYVETSADGTIDSQDVDTLIESIRVVVVEGATPRRF